MIYETAQKLDIKEQIDSSIVIEVIHSIFDDYKCSQWIRIRQDPKTGYIVVQHRFVNMRFKNLKEVINGGAADIILSTILHDFLGYINASEFTDMDYLSFHVFFKGRKISVQHMYFRDIMEDPADLTMWYSNKQAIAISSSFRKLLTFAGSCL